MPQDANHPPKRRILALTGWQPFPQLLALGFKTVENRAWAPRANELSRGDFLALHAGVYGREARRRDAWGWATELATKGGLLPGIRLLDDRGACFDEQGYLPRGRFSAGRLRHYEEHACPYGAIVGVARFDGAVTSPRGEDPWWEGPVGWYLSDPVVLVHPVPCRGDRGLWELPPKVLEQLRLEWRATRAGT